MSKTNVEQLAADRILENGVRVKLPAPFFLRLFGKKQVSLLIKQPYLGTLMHISRLALNAGFDMQSIEQGEIEAAHKLVSEHVNTASKIVAVAMLNSRISINLFSNLLARWLKYKIKPRKLAELAITIVLLSGIQDFTSSIRLIRSLRVTAPKNLSPADQGSQEDAEASIAPGEPSGA